MDTADLDPLAESFLLKSAELSYPQPVSFSYLDPFYQSQRTKPVEKRVLSKDQVVRVAPEEQAARLVSSPRHVRALVREPLKVTVDIVVGVDGHVWGAVPRNSWPERASQAAAGAARSFTYRPRKLEGQTVRRPA